MKLLPDHINHYIETLAKQGLSDATIERKTSSLKKFSQWAADKGYLQTEDTEVGASSSSVVAGDARGGMPNLTVIPDPIGNPVYNTLDPRVRGDDKTATDTIVIKASSQPLSDIVPAMDDPQKRKKRLYAVFLAAGGAALVLALLLLNRQFPVFRLFENFAKTEPVQTVVPTIIPSNTSQNNKTDQPTIAAAADPWTVFFKGKVTGLPGTSSLSGSLQFSLYREPTGGTALWTSKIWQLTPNEKGEFIAKLGDAAQQDTIIPQDIFFKHEYLYLGIRYLASDTGNQAIKLDQVEETTPRMKVSSAAHAADAAALAGHEPSEAATVGQIPVIDQTGALVLASQTPSLIAKSGTFKIQGQAITLATPAFSNGNITLAPDGEGHINLITNGSTGNQISARDANLTTGNLLYGAVGNDSIGYNLIELVSGSTPVTRFKVDALGNTTIGGTLSMGSLAVPIISSGTTSPIRFDSSFLFPTHSTVSATGDFTLAPTGFLNITAKIQNPGTNNQGRVYIEDTTQIAGHLFTRGIDAEGTVQLNGVT
ncbi:MAG: site-specific integrase, partial [Patescibacteria group bacterium]